MSRYLIDTHIAIFLMSGSEELESHLREILSDYNNLIYISTISAQEMLHMKKRNKIKLPWKKPDDILKNLEEVNIRLLPVKKEHLETYARLVVPELHQDPNDHVIISQAITEQMTLISSDRQFENYTNQQLDLIFNHR